MKGIQVRQGAVLFHRVGKLTPVVQTDNPRAPEKKGIWAFPWPYFEEDLVWQQYEAIMPKKLRPVTPFGMWPHSKEWYVTEDETPIASDEEVRFEYRDGDTRPFSAYVIRNGCRVDVYAAAEYDKAKSKWIEEIGKKVLPIKKFWYEGDLYAHFNPDATVSNTGLWGGDTEWLKIHTRDFARMVKKNRGTESALYERTRQEWQRMRYTTDFLEVFIPPGVGRIVTFRD